MSQRFARFFTAQAGKIWNAFCAITKCLQTLKNAEAKVLPCMIGMVVQTMLPEIRVCSGNHTNAHPVHLHCTADRYLSPILFMAEMLQYFKASTFTPSTADRNRGYCDHSGSKQLIYVDETNQSREEEVSMVRFMVNHPPSPTPKTTESPNYSELEQYLSFVARCWIDIDSPLLSQSDRLKKSGTEYDMMSSEEYDKILKSGIIPLQ